MLTTPASSNGPLKVPTLRFRPAYSGGLCNLDPEEWPYPTVFDLAGAQDRQELPILRDHDQRQKVGQTTSVEYTPSEINADGQMIHLGIDDAADKVLALWKRGAKLQASIKTGLIPADQIRFIPEGETVEVNGRTFNGPVEVVNEFYLREISIVTVGADSETQVFLEAALAAAHTKRKGKAMTTMQRIAQLLGLKSTATHGTIMGRVAQLADEEHSEPPTCAEGEEENKDQEAAAEDEAFTAWLSAQGFDPTTLGEAELGVLRKVYDGISANAEDAPEEKKEGDAEEAPEEKKEGEAEEAPPTEEKKEGAAAAGTRYARRSSRTRQAAAGLSGKKYPTFKGPGLDTSGAPHYCRVAEAALMLSGGRQTNELKLVGFTDRELDASQSHGMRGLTSKGLCYRAGVLSIDESTNVMRVAQAMQSATRLNALDTTRSPGEYRQGVAAGNLSNIDIPTIMANVMHKSMLVGQKTVPDPTNRLSQVVPATDTREQLFFTMTAEGKFAPVSDNGELENLKLSDTPYKNQAKFRGFELRLGYETIINDNTQALTQATFMVGRKAEVAKQRIWTEELVKGLTLASNPISALTGNPKFGLTGLDKAAAALKSSKDKDGDPIIASLKYVLVPTSLYNSAANIQHGLTIVAAAGSTTHDLVPNSNPFASTFEAIESLFIGKNGNVAGWADNGWMAFADPVDMPVMLMSYLNNQQSPTLMTVNGDYPIEGLKIGCWWCFGASLADTRGAVYSAGTGS